MKDTNSIKIYNENPRYWQYKGKPVLLVGGSVQDNLFQIPDLKEHLDLLQSVGGNYVRCVMGTKHDWDVYAFKKINGKYDLNQWNEEYWERFNSLLALSSERDIIVQVEMWATFNYCNKLWCNNPFNPINNVNYTSEESGLQEVVESHPREVENNFFRSVPKEMDLKVVLGFQQKFIDKLLSVSLPYNNVLYCMDNETHTSGNWGHYWSQYIKEKAKKEEKDIQTSEMYWQTNMFHSQHDPAFKHPEIYSFIEFSQNSANSGEQNWEYAQKIRSSLEPIRPMNNVKIYGSDEGTDGWEGSTRDGIERFWRNIIGGQASSRFHRPPWGLGLSTTAQANIKSMRMLEKRIDIFGCEPANDLLRNRKANSAYAMAKPGKEYAVYFTFGEPAHIDISSEGDNVQISWLDITKSEWVKEERFNNDKPILLQSPVKDHSVAVIKVI